VVSLIGKTLSHHKTFFLPPTLTADTKAQERLVREGQSASALDHPSIYTVHEGNETDDRQR